MTIPDINEASLDRRQAETLARLFNMAYNSAVLYGGNHQATKDGAIVFYNFVFKCINALGTLSIINERESVFVDNFCVDKTINTQRIIAHLKKAHVCSISFYPDLTAASVMALFEVLGDSQRYFDVEEMKKGLLLAHATGVRLNYVVYRKMTIDEAVVDKEIAEGNNSLSNNCIASSVLFTDASDLLTLKQLLEKPLENPKADGKDVNDSSEKHIRDVLSRVHLINEQIKNQDIASGYASSQELGLAVQVLKKDVIRNLDSLKAHAAMDGATEQVVSALDQLSYDVILNIVRQEYKAGKISLKRLAQIIRRIVPDVGELKRLLPRLKMALLSEGMDIGDYLKLVTIIRADIDSEGLEQLFVAATDEIGIRLDELLSAIKDDPQDAARLIILAAEIRKQNLTDTKEMSALLTEYIQLASREIALDSKETSGLSGIKLLEKTMGDVQKEIVGNLHKMGVSEPVIGQTNKLLSSRAAHELSVVKKEWLGKVLDVYKEYDEADLMRILPQLLHTIDDTALVHDTLSKTLLQKGYSDEKVKELFEKATPRRGQADLPKGLLNVSATIYFLEREIKRQQRYTTPFSCVIITPVRIWSKRGAPISVGEQETKCILPQLVSLVRKLLRDLDLVGSLGFVSRDVPFIILPMTDQNGSLSVMARLEKSVAAGIFECNKDPVTVDCAITSASFDTKTMEGYKQFLEQSLVEHKKKENLILKNKN